jgi:hypothetical protein
MFENSKGFTPEGVVTEHSGTPVLGVSNEGLATPEESKFSRNVFTDLLAQHADLDREEVEQAAASWDTLLPVFRNWRAERRISGPTLKIMDMPLVSQALIDIIQAGRITGEQLAQVLDCANGLIPYIEGKSRLPSTAGDYQQQALTAFSKERLVDLQDIVVFAKDISWHVNAFPKFSQGSTN